MRMPIFAHNPSRQTGQQAETDAEKMQKAGREDKTHGIGQRVVRGWQFGSVGVPMENAESPDHDNRNPERGTLGERDQHAEHHRGCGNSSITGRSSSGGSGENPWLLPDRMCSQRRLWTANMGSMKNMVVGASRRKLSGALSATMRDVH